VDFSVVLSRFTFFGLKLDLLCYHEAKISNILDFFRYCPMFPKCFPILDDLIVHQQLSVFVGMKCCALFIFAQSSNNLISY